jgi:hypothetical protein
MEIRTFKIHQLQRAYRNKMITAQEYKKELNRIYKLY